MRLAERLADLLADLLAERLEERRLRVERAEGIIFRDQIFYRRRVCRFFVDLRRVFRDFLREIFRARPPQNNPFRTGAFSESL